MLTILLGIIAVLLFLSDPLAFIGWCAALCALAVCALLAAASLGVVAWVVLS